MDLDGVIPIDTPGGAYSGEYGLSIDCLIWYYIPGGHIMEEQADKRWVTVSQACDIYGVTRRTLTRWIQQGKVESKL